MHKKMAAVAIGIMAFAMSAAAQTVTGSGTANTVPVFTGTSTVGNSPITISGSNVGIGTTSPAYQLDVSGVAPRIRVSTPNYGGLEIDNTNANSLARNWGIVNYWSNAGDLAIAQSAAKGGDPFSGTPVIYFAGTGGNVGIGTTSPGADYKLDVAGSVRVSGTLTFPDGVQTEPWNGTTLGGDYAESIDVLGDRSAYEPGDVIVIDDSVTGKFNKSAEAYSKLVAGVYSTKPGLEAVMKFMRVV